MSAEKRKERRQQCLPLDVRELYSQSRATHHKGTKTLRATDYLACPDAEWGISVFVS